MASTLLGPLIFQALRWQHLDTEQLRKACELRHFNTTGTAQGIRALFNTLRTGTSKCSIGFESRNVRFIIAMFVYWRVFVASCCSQLKIPIRSRSWSTADFLSPKGSSYPRSLSEGSFGCIYAGGKGLRSRNILEVYMYITLHILTLHVEVNLVPPR